jgi:hypothetical protein
VRARTVRKKARDSGGSVIGGSVWLYPGPTPLHLTASENLQSDQTKVPPGPGRALNARTEHNRCDKYTRRDSLLKQITAPVSGLRSKSSKASRSLNPEPQRAHGALAGAGGRVGSRPLAASPGSVVGRSGDFVASRRRLQLLER